MWGCDKMKECGKLGKMVMFEEIVHSSVGKRHDLTVKLRVQALNKNSEYKDISLELISR